MSSLPQFEKKTSLTLLDMGGGGGMMAAQKVFDHCVQTTVLKRFLVTFNIKHQKKLFLVPWVIQCYHSNEFVREHSRFPEVILR